VSVVSPLPRNPFELVVPQWQELPSGLLVASSVADRIRADREQPDVLPPELRQDLEPVAVMDEMPLSADQLAAALNEEELGLEPATLEQLIGTVERLPFEHSFLLLARLAAALWHVREDAQAQIQLVARFDMPVLLERVAELVAQHEARGSRLVVFAEQYITALQRLLIDHARPIDLAYEPTEWDLRSTVSAYFSTATIVSAADADLRVGEIDATRWLVYWLKNGLYNARPVIVNEFTRAREMFAVIAPGMVDHPEFCPIDEWFVDDYGLTAAEQHSAGFAAYSLSEALQENAGVGDRSLTAPPRWRGDLEGKATEANDLLSTPRAWYQEQFTQLGNDLDTLAWERRPFLRRPFLRLENGQWLLIAPRAIESWLGEGFLHRAMEASERRGESLRLRGFLGAVFERYCLDLTQSVYAGERPPGGGRVYAEQEYNRGGRQLTSDVAIDLGPDLVMIEVVARRLTQEMQVFGDREVLERNLAPMLFNKMAQLERVASDVFAGIATLPDVDIAHVERLWPVLVTAGDLMQTEILWDRIDERMPDALRGGRVQPLTVLDIGDFELLLGLVAEGHSLPSILARKSAGPYRRLELSRLVVDELHIDPPLTMRPPVMNERWDALAQEMRAVFAFGNEGE
jgi:hypothetical protein